MNAAPTLAVAACVVACIRSCKLLVPPENRREDAVEDEEYFTGEMDPFNRAVSVLAIEGFAAEERDDRIVPLAVSVVGLIDEKLDRFRPVEDTAVLVGVRADLNDKDAYVFGVDFTESDWVTVVKVFSSNDADDELK